MRLLLIILLLLSQVTLGQRIGSLDQHPINLHIKGIGGKSDPVMTLLKTDKFKLTIKTGINAKTLGTELHDMGSEPYLSMGKYDIRAKFYVSNKIRVILRMVNLATMIGVPSKGYAYLCGISYKF